MSENQEVQNQQQPSPDEGSAERTPQATDTPVVSREDRVVPVKDLDALRSIKDKEIAAREKRIRELEERLAQQEQQRQIAEERARTAEAMASESQRLVNLRQSAKAAASRIALSYGEEIAKVAEEKFLKAESSEHLSALMFEFYNDDLSSLLGVRDKQAAETQRRQQAMSETVGVTTAAIPPATPTSVQVGGLDKVRANLERARVERLWKSSPEGQAALREARSALLQAGYPGQYLPRRCSWAQIANALSTLDRLGIGTGKAATTRL